MTDYLRDEHANQSYAIHLANDSYEWYKTAATRSRRAYKVSELALLIVSAAIPAIAAVTHIVP